jgi:hypothetical protein
MSPYIRILHWADDDIVVCLCRDVEEDAAVEQAIEDQDRVDPKMWK